jgi:integrase
VQLDRLADESGRYRSLVLLLGVGGQRWGEAAALRFGDVDFLRRRVYLRRNAVVVSDRVIVGTLKANKDRTVALPPFVIDALAMTAAGKGRDELLWLTAARSPLGPPVPSTSWLAYAVTRRRKADPSFPRVAAHALRTHAELFDSDLDTVAEDVAKLWPQQANPH